jgi:hypothetical protein
MNAAGLLVVVPCGQGKIWDRHPGAGPSPAEDAYTGAPFRVNRAYAERFASRWVILSAKYGFIDPGFVIPEPYNVTFKKRHPAPVEASVLREQVSGLDLATWPDVVVLGGAEYQNAVRTAFAGTSATLHFPFAGLPLGRAMSAANAAIASGQPLSDGVVRHRASVQPEETSVPDARAPGPSGARPGKYTPLAELLRHSEVGRVALSFEEIESIIDAPLPASARSYSAWWSGDVAGTHRWVNEWIDAGWRLESLSLGGERAVFVRRS